MMIEDSSDVNAFNDTNQENNRKLFVGGLSWETTSDSLRAYMSRYGEVVDCSVKVDVSTGRSRGFGFVMFKKLEEADIVLKTRPHMLDGKIIDPKKASGMPITKKIFVGGVRSETTDDALREYFTQFGSVHSLDFPIDHTTSKRREFDEPDAAERAMNVNFHSIGSQTVEVKPAYTKEQQQALMARGMWPPQNTSKQGQVPYTFDMNNIDTTTQATLKGLLGSYGAQADASGQMNQMAAAALFYQTYFQYALALSAATNVAPVTNGTSQEAVENQASEQAKEPATDGLNSSNENGSVRSSDRKPRKTSVGKRSPRREPRPDRSRRRRSSSDSYRRRRRRSRSLSRRRKVYSPSEARRRRR